jgi:IclR family transcriptional regulator, acetate operon repressor
MATKAAADSADGVASGGIQVLSRSFAILRALEGETAGLSLSQLAERTGLPRSSVHRLVTALEAENFLSSASPSGGVRLGPELVRLAQSVRPDLRSVLRDTVQALYERVNETVDLAILDGDHVRFVDQIAAPHRLRAVSAVGESFPLHCTANGKAILALMPEATARVLLPDRLPRHTPHTRTTRKALLAELEEVRRTSIAFDREEHTEGISAVGFAVRHGPATIAAITVPMPTARFDDREAEIVAAVLAAREEALAAISASA